MGSPICPQVTNYYLQMTKSELGMRDKVAMPNEVISKENLEMHYAHWLIQNLHVLCIFREKKIKFHSLFLYFFIFDIFFCIS